MGCNPSSSDSIVYNENSITGALVSFQSCRIVDSDAWCKRTLRKILWMKERMSRECNLNFDTTLMLDLLKKARYLVLLTLGCSLQYRPLQLVHKHLGLVRTVRDERKGSLRSNERFFNPQVQLL